MILFYIVLILVICLKRHTVNDILMILIQPFEQVFIVEPEFRSKLAYTKNERKKV